MNNRVLIIAEAGVNHNGNIKIALELVDKAKEARADIIKFQTMNPEKLVSKHAKKAVYQNNNLNNDDSQLEMLKKLALSIDEFDNIRNYCNKLGIQFLSTPFDLDSIDFLNGFDMPFWKIPSGEITNYPYLVKIAKTHKDIVMSTGMSELKEIEEAMKVLKDNGCNKISLLHCNTEYPTPFEDVNLKAMLTLKDKFNVEVGYSDHTKGIEVSMAAVAMGATIIEKHFTLDRDMEGPDHKASLEPDELKLMVECIRNIEKSLGNGVKQISASEKKNIEIARKSIVANCNIKKGEVFTEKNITTKRPGNGISPMRWNEVIGKEAIKDFNIDDLIIL